MKIKKSLFMLLVIMLIIVNFSAAQDNPGCMDEGACNYDPTAVVDDASCVYSQTFYIDADGDGIGTDHTVYYGCDMPLGFAAISGDCDDNNSAIIGPPGNPNEWGQGEWNAYVYQGVYFDNYKGYFVRQGDTYNSEIDFNAWGTPMSSPGYMGCPVSDDFHSIRYKRQGFPTVDFPYAITVPSWDDDVYVYVDGILVWSAGCCAGGLSNNVVWTGDLNENSTVEISFGEYGGASYLAFLVEPQYPLSFNGSTMLYQNACYGFDYYTQVFQNFDVDPSSMTYSISSANQLIDVNNVDIQFSGSEVVFHLTPNQILGEDLLTFVVADSMGFTDTLLVNISLGECPPPLDIYGSTNLYHDACSDFEIFIGINSPLGYVNSDLTFVTTFSDTTFVFSSEPEYVNGWGNGQYSYFYAAGKEGSTVATTVVTDPMGNSDTLVTLLTFGTCSPVLDVDFNPIISCGDSTALLSVTYAFNTPGVEQSLNNIQAYNNYAIPNENIVLVATTDTVIVSNGFDYYGSNYQFEVQFANLGEWAEVLGFFTDEFNFNYEFWSYFESIIDDNAPVITADADVIEIVLPWGTCDTIVNWDVILNPINAFGAGSNYVTNQHNGSFYAAINGGAGLTTLGVDGNSGADGSGSLEQLSYPITSANGDQYTVYTAIFDGNGDPWIYPMWIVPASEDEVTTSVDEDLSDSRFVLENLSGTPQPYFYYLFASKSNEAPYDLSSLQSVSQLLVDGFSPYLNNDSLDLESLSNSMDEIMNGIQDSVLNDGKYYTINIDGSVEWNLNDQPVGINDGGNDIYDGGNFLVSNFNDYYAEGEESIGIPYTNGAVVLGGPSEGETLFTLFVNESCSFDLVSSIESGSTLYPGTNLIEFVASDNSGNESTYSVEINVFIEAEYEVCNQIDDDCDGEIDEFVTIEYFYDGDQDGFGYIENVAYACETPEGYVVNSDDCDDNQLTYVDADGDGFGINQLEACGVLSQDDCDDSNANIYLESTEICGNQIDENCDGIDEVCIINGCTDNLACNFDSNANNDDGSCTYPTQSYLNCAGNCINDTDADGVCDELEVLGCTDEVACNYDANATDNGPCTYPTQSYLNCAGNCINDTDADGVCNELEVAGCSDVAACNYDASATDNGPCTYPTQSYLNCAGNCINDTDADGVCNELEVLGCTDVVACNYDASATDNGSCTYPTQSYLNCSGNCINDTDADGVCNELEVLGCTDVVACNYDATATDNGTCTYPIEFYLDCAGNCINDTDADGVCDELEVLGCTDVASCNYDANATEDDGSCILPSEEVCNDADDDCDGEVDEFVTNTYFIDADGDGFGSAQEVLFACSMPMGYATNSDDCDDALLTYEDNDNDGFGSTVSVACGIENNTDCDDNNAQINSGIAELCNGIDDNCNGSTDDGLVFTDYYTDADVDGYGSGTAISFCTNPGAGFSTTNDDCDDMNAQINPGATEIEGNQVDENCDGEVLSVNTIDLIVEMYPNPTRNQFTVVNTAVQGSELIIYNAQGKLAFKTTMTEDKLMIDCSAWSPGIYLVQMQYAGTIKSATLIVQ